MYKHTTKESTFTSANCTPIQFIGQYTTQGGKYYQNTTTNLLIKICERKQPTALKPRLYVVSKTIEGQFPFITSLYPQPKEDHYTAEIDRKYFNVCLTEETITITQK